MQLKLFILPVKNLAAAEAEMNGFLRAHRVLAVKKEFVADGENSFWRRNNLRNCSGSGAGGSPVRRATRGADRIMAGQNLLLQRGILCLK
jgi:hypothetical protein